jgi:uncharacterized 2Fe-2S/4Fe-4S cluster protein (DUF4445 family)
VFISKPVSTLEDFSTVIEQYTGQPPHIDKNLQNEYAKKQITFGIKEATAVLISTADSEGWSLVGIEEGDTSESIFGVAVDIGTTTIVTRLINLQTLEVAATVSAGNPQDRYGTDVISRIGFAETDAGLTALHNSIVSCLNNLLDKTAQKAGIKTGSIYEAVIVGNTTMNHLLLKYPTRQLGQAPYEAYSLLPTNQKATELGLHINPAGTLYTPPNIAGFVGSDTVAGALACGMDTIDTVTLLVDIGTNGEIVFGTKKCLFAASCAAGPALEGAGITCGSRAQAGAIERVIYDQDDIDIDVIGRTKPATICGSGLIDAVAVLLDTGIIDATGRFADSDELAAMMLPQKLTKRLIVHRNEPAFMLAGNSHSENAVILTQKDVRQIQLAKGAIQAGILLLLKQAGYDAPRIQQIFLAGAFGNYIQKENALRIGLLPNISVEKIHFVGNAAGSGAQMMLINRLTRKLAEELAQKIEYIEIAHRDEFQDVFSQSLLFPEK